MALATDDDVVTLPGADADATDEHAEGLTADGNAAGDAGTGDGDADGETADEVVISIGEPAEAAEEAEDTRAPDWVRDLRKANRDKDRRIRELEQRLQTPAAGQTTEIVVGEKPTLKGCDFDEDKFETEIESWHERKRKADDAVRHKADAERKAQEAWQGRLDVYKTQKAALKIKDFEEAEDVVKDILSVTQQGVILQGAKNSALLVAALGKNPKKAKELAAITDPVKFAFAAAEVEAQLKVTARKGAPIPERLIRGSAPGSSSVDSELARLQKEADKTGDRSKVAQYIRQKASRQAA